jgi:hypothetical protein
VAVFPEDEKPEKLVYFGFEKVPRDSAQPPNKLEMFTPAEVRIKVRLFLHITNAVLESFAGFGTFADILAILRRFSKKTRQRGKQGCPHVQGPSENSRALASPAHRAISRQIAFR